MANEQISMPSGMGGITRYFEDYQSKFQFSPEYVVGLVAILIVLEIALRFF